MWVNKMTLATEYTNWVMENSESSCGLTRALDRRLWWGSTIWSRSPRLENGMFNKKTSLVENPELLIVAGKYTDESDPCIGKSIFTWWLE